VPWDDRNKQEWLASDAGTSSPDAGPGAGASSPDGGPRLTLKDQALEDYTYAEMIGDREPAPSSSALRNNPEFALSTIFVRVAKRPGTRCDSDKPEDFKWERLFKHQLDSCVIDARPNTVALTIKKVSGQAAASFAHLLGGVNASSEYAYEFSITEPVVAVEEDPSKCFDAQAIMKMRLPQRTCEVRYITGAVLSQITSREFKEIKAEGSVASAVQLSGKAYGATDNVVNRFALTVNTIPASQYFLERPAFGYLMNYPLTDAGTVDDEAAAALLRAEDAGVRQPDITDAPKITVLAHQVSANCAPDADCRDMHSYVMYDLDVPTLAEAKAFAADAGVNVRARRLIVEAGQRGLLEDADAGTH
jgi:hypothetical protein